MDVDGATVDVEGTAEDVHGASVDVDGATCDVVETTVNVDVAGTDSDGVTAKDKSAWYSAVLQYSWRLATSQAVDFCLFDAMFWTN